MIERHRQQMAFPVPLMRERPTFPLCIHVLVARMTARLHCCQLAKAVGNGSILLPPTGMIDRDGKHRTFPYPLPAALPDALQCSTPRF